MHRRAVSGHVGPCLDDMALVLDGLLGQCPMGQRMCGIGEGRHCVPMMAARLWGLCVTCGSLAASGEHAQHAISCALRG